MLRLSLIRGVCLSTAELQPISGQRVGVHYLDPTLHGISELLLWNANCVEKLRKLFARSPEILSDPVCCGDVNL